MSGEIYTLDTNVLVYAIDRASGARHETAKTIMSRAASGPCCLTLQAISEFYAAVTRKGMMQPAEAAPIAQAMIDLFRTTAATAGAVRSALQTATARHASYWDALLIHAAAEAGCSAILTEDLADGATLGGVRVVNPFAGAGLSAAAEALLSTE